MIRQCTVYDLESLKEISYKTFDQTFRPQNQKKNIDHYLKTAFTKEKLVEELRHPHSNFHFIYYNNKLAGYLKTNILEAQTEQIKAHSLEIERIYILQDYQKCGLGKQLFNQAIAIAEEKECAHVWLGVWEKNINAIEFYEELGFKSINEHAFYMGNERQIDKIMIKPLKEEYDVYSKTL